MRYVLPQNTPASAAHLKNLHELLQRMVAASAFEASPNARPYYVADIHTDIEAVRLDENMLECFLTGLAHAKLRMRT